MAGNGFRVAINVLLWCSFGLIIIVINGATVAAHQYEFASDGDDAGEV